MIEGVLRGVDGVAELDENFAGMNDELAFLHDAMRARAGHGNDGNSRLDGHDRSSLFELLKAAIGTARAFRVDEEGLAVAQGFDGLVDAVDSGLAIETIDGNEVREVKGLADDGPVEERTLEKNGDAARDGADHGGGVGGTGVIRGEDAGAGRNALGAFHVDVDAGAVDEKHDAFHSGPVEGINVLGEEGVDQQRRADDEDIETDENGNESGTEHG